MSEAVLQVLDRICSDDTLLIEATTNLESTLDKLGVAGATRQAILSGESKSLTAILLIFIIVPPVLAGLPDFTYQPT